MKRELEKQGSNYELLIFFWQCDNKRGSDAQLRRHFDSTAENFDVLLAQSQT